MAEIVVAEFMGPSGVDALAAEHEVLDDPTLVDDRARLLTVVGDARALVVRNRTRVDRELLAAAPALRVVGRLGVGLDNIDVEACRERGVAVRPATGANADAVAEYVIAVTLLLVRGTFDATSRIIAGEWPREELVGRELAGRHLGLVGFGDIARRVATRATALGMSVTAHDPMVRDDDPVWALADRGSLDETLSRSDVVSVHVPLTDGTRHLIDAAAIARMPRGAVVVNTSRGGVVDEDALADALRTGHLGGAALDVFEREPPTPDDVARFAELRNVVLTPHIAGLTVESGARVASVTAQHVLSVLDGPDGLDAEPHDTQPQP